MTFVMPSNNSVAYLVFASFRSASNRVLILSESFCISLLHQTWDNFLKQGQVLPLYQGKQELSRKQN